MKNIDCHGGSQAQEHYSNAVIRRACTEFCRRREGQNFNYLSAGLCLKHHCQCVAIALSLIVRIIFKTKTQVLKGVSCRQVLKSVCCRQVLESVCCRQVLKSVCFRQVLKSVCCRQVLKSVCCRQVLKRVCALYTLTSASVSCSCSRVILAAVPVLFFMFCSTRLK